MIKKKISFSGIGVFVLLTVLSITFIIPFVFMFFNSIKTRADYIKNPFGWPTEFVWSNFATMISQFEIQKYMLNTLFISCMTICLMLLLSIIPSYIFAKKSFQGKNLCYFFIICSMFMPAQVTLIPLYVMYSEMNLVNNPWSVIFCFVSGGIPSCIMLLTAYFRGIPNEVCEAAVIDGCSFIQMVAKVVLPMGKPAVAINVIFTFLSTWNELFTPLILLNDREKQSVMVALNSLVSRYSSDPTFQMAGLTIVTVPVIIVYLFIQKYLVEGINAGAVK